MKRKREANFVEAYSLAEAAQDEDGVVAAMHAMRKALIQAKPEESWTEAYRAYSSKVCAWVRTGGSKAQIVALRSFVRLCGVEGLDHGRAAVRLLTALCDNVSSDALSVLEAEARKYDDLRLWILRSVKRSSAKLNACEVLMRLAVPNEPVGRLCEDSDLEKQRRLLGEAWIAALAAVEFNDELLKRVLTHLPEHVLPVMSRPLRLADFFVAAFEAPNTAMQAFHGIFVLMTQHNLDYPGFYDALLGLVTPDMFYGDYDRFLDLARVAVISSHVPGTRRAAFATKLARAASLAPPRGIVAALRVLVDLAQRCPLADAALAADCQLRRLATTHYSLAVRDVVAGALASPRRPPLDDIDDFTYDALLAKEPEPPSFKDIPRDEPDGSYDVDFRPLFVVAPEGAEVAPDDDDPLKAYAAAFTAATATDRATLNLMLQDSSA